MATLTEDRYTALTDEQWERFEPLLPSNKGCRGRPFENNRKIVDGIVYRARTGIQWRDLGYGAGPDPGRRRRRRGYRLDGFRTVRRYFVGAALEGTEVENCVSCMF